MDVAGLISNFATGDFTVTRTVHAAPIRGREQQGTQSTFTITAPSHPANGNDLKKLPEGRRTNETRVVYSSVELLIGGEGAANEADVVTIDGQDWEVEHVEVWRDSTSRAVGYRCIVQAVR